MGTFDIRQDAPGLLRAESLNITLKFDRTSDTTGRISWNIPIPAAGCAAGTQAYDGIILTLDTTVTSSSKIPTNGIVYTSDSTADSNLFAGDKIGTSLVVGTFYHDKTTTFVDVSGLKPNTPYYITGFPVDAQYRYYIEGIHAYSLKFANRSIDGTHGSQVVVMNPEQTDMGIQPTDPTGLVTATNYEFSIQLGIVPSPQAPVDSTACNPSAPKYTITVDGTYAQTYQELVDEINKQFALLDNPTTGPYSPNTGSYYWNNTQKKLFQWNGTTYVEITNVIVQPTDPSTIITGTYWYDLSNDVLKIWTGSAWNSVTVISFNTDPTLPVADATYWFDGTDGYLWNGIVWCKILTYTTLVDPSLPPIIPAGSYWLDIDNGILFRWNNTLQTWTETTAIQYPTDPNTLPNNAYWFNESNNNLYAYNVPNPGWNTQSNVAITETEPTTPAPGKFWYNPTTMDLYQRNLANTSWILLDVIAFPVDPTLRHFCDLWWDTSSDTLYVWNNITHVWSQVTDLYQQSIDPSLPPTIEDGTLWYNSSTNTLEVWNNACFKPVSTILWPTDPTSTIPVGTVWHDLDDDLWYVRQVGNIWSLISPILSQNDPTTLAVGTFWFNTTNSALQTWNGATWTIVTYTLSPAIPTVGTLWFDSNTNMLKYWNGTSWVNAITKAVVEIDCHGNLLFTDNTVGSLSFVQITDNNLFSSLLNKFTLHDPKPGTDGSEDQPTYDQLGIGTDGSADERLLIQNEIRYELGYPVMDVELTPEQLDYAITRALNELRQKSDIAYERGYYFMRINANTQKFYLTNKIQGMQKIVDVLGVYRLTSSFLSSAHGAGVYGQVILQHLYNMGTYDLLSHHIMAQYTTLMEHLFASRVTFTWNESRRELFLHQSFPLTERVVCIEATSERTEQDIMSDRYARPWIRRYALAVARMMLAEIRGKYSSLPGANGSISLNASELRLAAQNEIEALLLEIDDYVASRPEMWGSGGSMVIG